MKSHVPDADIKKLNESADSLFSKFDEGAIFKEEFKKMKLQKKYTILYKLVLLHRGVKPDSDFLKQTMINLRATLLSVFENINLKEIEDTKKFKDKENKFIARMAFHYGKKCDVCKEKTPTLN